MSPSALSSRLRRSSSSTPRNAEPRRGPGADLGRALADPAGEGEHVEAAERGRHRRDRRAQAVEVDVERERAPRGSPRRARARAARACRRCRPARAGRSGARARRPARLAESASCSSSHSSSPGSTLPERVAITRPSSGVKPIVVSTERPSAIAHSEAPAPRWQLTIRSSAGRRAEQLAARAARPRRARGRGSRSGAGPSARATRAGSA